MSAGVLETSCRIEPDIQAGGIKGMIKKDLLRNWDLARGNKLQKMISVYRSPGAHAVVVFRFGHWLKRRNIVIRILLEPLYALQYNWIRTRWGIEINRSARIGEGLYIGHFGGVQISGAITIGRNASISQKTVVGGRGGKGEDKGAPTIGDNVYIAPGAVIFGKIKIGDNVKIGANTVIYDDIPDNAIVVLDPGYKIVSYKGNPPLKE